MWLKTLHGKIINMDFVQELQVAETETKKTKGDEIIEYKKTWNIVAIGSGIHEQLLEYETRAEALEGLEVLGASLNIGHNNLLTIMKKIDETEDIKMKHEIGDPWPPKYRVE